MRQKNGVAVIYLLLVYDASKLNTVYEVKWPVLGLQREPENLEFAPSVKFSLNRSSGWLLGRLGFEYHSWQVETFNGPIWNSGTRKF